MAIASANPLYGAGMTAKAILGAVPSQLPTDDAQQRGRASYRALSRGHHACVVSNQCKKGFSFSNRTLTLTPDDWRGLNCAPSFSRNSHRQVSSPCRRSLRFSRRIGHNSPGRAFMAAPGAFHSPHSTACRRFRAQSVGHQHRIDRVADVPHLSRLSSSLFSSGIDPNEKELTLAKILFASGANKND